MVRFLRWMADRDWPVLFFGDPETRMYRRAEQDGLAVRPLVSRMKTGDLLSAWRFSRELRGRRIRFLTVHQSQDLFLGAAATRLTGKRTRLIYSQHMHIGRDKKDLYHRWLYGRLDAVATPVPWLAARVREKTTISDVRIHVVPRGIELPPYTTEQPRKDEARRRFDVPQDVLMIGLVGRLDYKKGQHIAIEALSALHRAGHRAHLLFVGSQTYAEGDEYVERINAMVREHSLTDYIHFRPHDEHPEYAYAGLDIFVLASKSECYGMVTIEAMASGLPVVGTADGGTLDLIRDGENGLLVTPFDSDALARALLRLIEDPALARRLADTACREAPGRFSHTVQCEAWEKLLKTLDRE